MKAQHSHPRVRPAAIVKRRTPPITKVAARRPRPRRRRGEQEQGTSVLWLLMIVGGIIATGFIFALRSQHTVHQLDQAEAQLRADLDRISEYQRHLALEQQRALSVRESEQMAKQSGLIQPKLPSAYAAPPPTKSGLSASSIAKPAPATITAKPAAATITAKPAAVTITAKPAAATVTTKPASARSLAKPVAAPAKPAAAIAAAKPKKESDQQRPQSRLAQRR